MSQQISARINGAGVGIFESVGQFFIKHGLPTRHHLLAVRESLRETGYAYTVISGDVYGFSAVRTVVKQKTQLRGDGKWTEAVKQRVREAALRRRQLDHGIIESENSSRS